MCRVAIKGVVVAACVTYGCGKQATSDAQMGGDDNNCSAMDGEWQSVDVQYDANATFWKAHLGKLSSLAASAEHTGGNQ